jgi:hypothetical protein
MAFYDEASHNCRALLTGRSLPSPRSVLSLAGVVAFATMYIKFDKGVTVEGVEARGLLRTTPNTERSTNDLQGGCSH